MVQNGTATITTAAPQNVGSAAGALSVGQFTNSGLLAVSLQGVTGAPVVLQPGQSVSVQVPIGQVLGQALPAASGGPGVGPSGGVPYSGGLGVQVPTSTTLLYLIGALA